MTSMDRTRKSWTKARDSLDAMCSKLAAVPGAGDEYDAMCVVVGRMQTEGDAIIGAAERAFEEAR